MNDEQDVLQQQASFEQEDEHHYPRWIKAGVIVFCIGVVIVWGVQIHRRLQLSLPILGDGTTAVVDNIKASLADASDEQLRAQDTDQDGLNDYDEINTYKTSPYISDSDSDGLSDKDEVEAGTDPNCAEGTDCYSLPGSKQTTSVATNNASPFSSEEFQKILSNPQQLRQFLIQGGIDASVVASLDDQTVQLLAQQAFNDITQPTQQKLEVLQNLDADQIRGLLKAAGKTDQELADYTDEELLNIYQEFLSTTNITNPGVKSTN